MTSFTFIHVGISVVAILSGFVVLSGMLTSKRLDGWTNLFLASTTLTSVTGFFFPFHGVTPAIVLGIISLVVLVVVIFARYTRNLAGPWRKTYVISALLALYLNVFVSIVQAFERIPVLKKAAPTQKDLLFKSTELVALVVFIVLGIVGSIRFRAEHVSGFAPQRNYLRSINPNT